MPRERYKGRDMTAPKTPQQDARNVASLLNAEQLLLLNRLALTRVLLGYYFISNQKFRRYFTVNIFLSGHMFS